MPTSTEHRIHFTYGGVGLPLDGDNLDARLDRWEQAHPEFGPVGTADLDHGTIGITISLLAFDLDHALSTARAYERDTWRGDEKPYPVIGISAIPCSADD